MVERIKKLCKERKINFSRLERTLDFANGSLAKSREDTIGAIRVKAIADYFGVSMEYILCGTTDKNRRLSSEEKSIIDAYRQADSLTKAMVIRTLGIEEAEEKRDIGKAI